jgi:hypothetical protein
VRVHLAGIDTVRDQAGLLRVLGVHWPVCPGCLCAAARGRFPGTRRLRLREAGVCRVVWHARLGTIAAWPMTRVSPLVSGT